MVETGWCVKKPPAPRGQSCHARPEVLNFGGGFFYALLHCRHLANIARMGEGGRAFFTHQPVSRYWGVALSICTANDPLCQSGHYNGDRISCHTTQHVSGCDMLAAESGRYQIRREYSIPDTTSLSIARRLHDDDKRSKQPICHRAHFVYKQLQVQHKIPAMSRVHA